MSAPKFLVVTNEARLGTDAPGVHAAFDELQQANAISAIQYSSWKPQARESVAARDARLVRDFAGDYDYAVLLSPRSDSMSENTFDALEHALGSRPLAIWEGDAIALTTMPRLVRRWFKRSDVVFSQSGSPQPEIILRAGATKVFHLPATYCHVQFATAEQSPPSRDFEHDAVMIASESRSIRRPFGISGSVGRRRLASKLRRAQLNFDLAGRGWPSSWNAEPLPFSQQSTRIRKARLSVNWDHAPRFADSSSNRLPISLISGRIHVTTRHPGMAWLPTSELGLFQEGSVSDMIDRIREILAEPDEKIFSLGKANWDWSRGRLSHRQSVQYQYQTLTGIEVPSLPSEPWAHLPGPWDGSEGN